MLHQTTHPPTLQRQPRREDDMRLLIFYVYVTKRNDRRCGRCDEIIDNNLVFTCVSFYSKMICEELQ
jgi:hypothetical protein